jgi:general secretion pathway protein E
MTPPSPLQSTRAFLRDYALDDRLILSLRNILGEALRDIVPLSYVAPTLYLGHFEPVDASVQANLSQKLKNPPIEWTLLDMEDYALWQECCYEHLKGVADSTASLSAPPSSSARPPEPSNKPSKVMTTVGAELDERQISEQVRQLILDALECRASDIHFEPMPQGLLVRFRIDGLLKEVALMPPNLSKVVLARVKVLAELDIANQRTPQDGRSTERFGQVEVDLRVSTLPCLHGEKAVIRLLPKTQSFQIEEVGFSFEQLKRFRSWLGYSQGLVLITGPTGSGKTSTLYAGLMNVLTPTKNIVTIEDPIEYQLSSVNQVQVNPKAGLTFASGLRSILRQDPDVIMVGEIRDLETAQTVFQAAVTGHLVLSTLHTNDAPSTVNRLLDMGIEPYLLAASLLGVVAQRLVRKICPHCCQEYEPNPLDIRRLGIEKVPSATRWQKPVGCDLCNHMGYLGREGIFEMMPVDGPLRQMIRDRASEQQMRDHLEQNLGERSLNQSAVQKVMEGKTSIEEVLRVVTI